jgi:hypothetical protein
MNSAAWNAWLATLPADRREEYGIVLERITKIVDEMRSYLLDQLQRVERRQDGISQRQADQASRLDTYEEQRARDVRLELDQRLADTITREEHDALMTVIYELTTRIAQVEELRGLTVRVQALELRMQERGGDAEQR